MSLRVIRFGPLEGYGTWKDARYTPGCLGADGFPEGTYEDIPENTRLRIVGLPSRRPVFDGTVSRAYSRDFDIGKYGYMLKKNLPMPEDDPSAKSRCLIVTGVFLVDVTEEQWASLRDKRPRYVTARQTSDGPQWSCNACSYTAKTRLAAFIHEQKEHFNIDPLTDPKKAALAEAGVYKPVAVQSSVGDPALAAITAAKRGGRPKGSKNKAKDLHAE